MENTGKQQLHEIFKKKCSFAENAVTDKSFFSLSISYHHFPSTHFRPTLVKDEVTTWTNHLFTYVSSLNLCSKVIFLNNFKHFYNMIFLHQKREQKVDSKSPNYQYMYTCVFF